MLTPNELLDAELSALRRGRRDRIFNRLLDEVKAAQADRDHDTDPDVVELTDEIDQLRNEIGHLRHLCEEAGIDVE